MSLSDSWKEWVGRLETIAGPPESARLGIHMESAPQASLWEAPEGVQWSPPGGASGLSGAIRPRKRMVSRGVDFLHQAADGFSRPASSQPTGRSASGTLTSEKAGREMSLASHSEPNASQGRSIVKIVHANKRDDCNHANLRILMGSTPLVSVCIPVYNTERFVAEAIHSVLDQSFQDLEVVIVDNASTDSTPGILAKFADPRVRLFRNKQNIGAAGNFNRALSLARGRYIKLLCADDVLYPMCLEKQVAILEADGHAAVSMVCSSRDIIDSRGKRWLRRAFPGPPGRMDGARASALSVRRGTNLFGEPGAVLARAESVRAVGGFDPRYSYCIDLDFWCRLLSTGDLHVIDETLCAFRLSEQSWSLSLGRRQHVEFAEFIEDLHKVRGLRLTWFDRFSGRLRSHANAYLRQGLTRFILYNSRSRA